MRTVRKRMKRTSAAITSSAMSPDAMSVLLFVDERRGALDLRDLDPRAGLEHLSLHERARRPLLAADLHAAPVGVDPLEHGRAGADERLRPRPQLGRHAQVLLRDRAQN